MLVQGAHGDFSNLTTKSTVKRQASSNFTAIKRNQGGTFQNSGDQLGFLCKHAHLEGGDYPYLLIILEVPSYLQIIRFCLIILICLCSRVDGDSYVLDVQAVEACNSLSRMLFLTIPGMYREG